MNLDFSILTHEDSKERIEVSSQSDSVKHPSIAQKGLLIVRIACSIIALIPDIKVFGMIGMRSMMFFVSSKACVKDWSHDDALNRFSKCAKVSVVVLGITAVASGAPYLLVTSIVANIGLQVFDCIKAAYEKNSSKAFTHLSVATLFTVAVTAPQSWHSMLMTSLVTVIAMGMMAIKVGREAKHWSDIAESIAYVGLIVLNISRKVLDTDIHDLPVS